MDGRDRDIGQNIAYWRRRRGLTQQIFADRIGVSKSLLEKIEAGTRSGQRLSMLERIGEVLGVDVDVLAATRPAQQADECLDSVEIDAIQDALLRYDGITRVFRPQETPEVPDVEMLRRNARYCWDSFQASRYAVLGRFLPGLITDAQYATSLVSDTERPQAEGLLAEAYQIAASTLRKHGEYERELLAAERGIQAAERSSDLLLVAGGSFRLANAVLDTGHPHRAVELNVTAANSLASETQNSSEASLSLYGHLFLQGGMAAARASDPARTRELLDEARDTANRAGWDGNAQYIAFGPTNVAVHRVSALVELGDGGLAVETAHGIDTAGLPRERRGSHLVTVARGYSLGGRRPEAEQTLYEAERIASEEVLCRPNGRNLVADLLQRTRRPSVELRQLARRAELPV